MQSPLLSIIVPVYNVEAYIEKCLLSLQAQSYSNIEIICVDDASPDNSAALITKMSENDKRIHLIRHEENQGLFHARLSGLKIAQGEFVAFADSDDYVSCDWFRPLIKTAMEDNADMVLGNTINVSEDGTRTYYNHYRSFNRNKKPLTKDRLLSSFFSQQGECFIWHTVWNKVYRKSLFDRALPFLEKMKPPLVMGEDIAFSSVLYALADKLSFCDNDCYFYYRHSDASTGLAHSSDRFKKYVRDICKVFAFVQDFLTSNDYPTAVIGDFMRFKEKYFRIWSGNIRAAGFENDKEIVKCLLNGFEKKSLASVNDGEFYFYEQSTEWDEKFEELRYKISQPEVKIVSFDIFDTLITRPFWEAQDLFYFVAERIGFSNPLTFVSMRKEAEAVCRKAAKMLDSSVEDVTLADIYSFMGKLFGFPPKKAERMQKAEEEAELFFCRSRQAGKVLYDLALFLGKKVILTSDMYLEENVVRQILDENGYRDHAKLYLSSVHKRLKTTGRLFRLMLKEEDVAPENVLHIGDNWQADIVSAQKMRIPTLFFPKATETFSNNISNIYTGDSFKEIYCGIHKNIDSRGLLQQLPLRCMFAVAAYGGFDDPRIIPIPHGQTYASCIRSRSPLVVSPSLYSPFLCRKKEFEKVLDAGRGACDYIPCAAALAQLDRAFDYESKGRRFESYMPHHNELREGPRALFCYLTQVHLTPSNRYERAAVLLQRCGNRLANVIGTVIGLAIYGRNHGHRKFDRHRHQRLIRYSRATRTSVHEMPVPLPLFILQCLFL